MGKHYVIRLSHTQRKMATRLAESTDVPARVQLCAAILMAAHNCQSDLQIATGLRTSVSTVQRTRKRYATEGFHAAIRWPNAHSARRQHSPLAEPEWSTAVIAQLEEIDGLLGLAVVDFEEGKCLARDRGDGLDLDKEAACNTEVVRAKLATIGRLGLGDSLEDILMTMSSQYHLIRVLPTTRLLFVFAILDRHSANLALARHQFAALDWSVVR